MSVSGTGRTLGLISLISQVPGSPREVCASEKPTPFRRPVELRRRHHRVGRPRLSGGRHRVCPSRTTGGRARACASLKNSTQTSRSMSQTSRSMRCSETMSGYMSAPLCRRRSATKLGRRQALVHLNKFWRMARTARAWRRRRARSKAEAGKG